MERRTTVSNSLRSRSQSRKRPCLFLEKVECSGTSPSSPSRQNQRKRGSGAPPRTTDVRNECRSNSQPATSGPAFGINRRPASRAVKWSQVAPNVCKSTKRSIDLSKRVAGRVAQVRTRKTAPLDHRRGPIIASGLPPTRPNESANFFRFNRIVFQHNLLESGLQVGRAVSRRAKPWKSPGAISPPRCPRARIGSSYVGNSS